MKKHYILITLFLLLCFRFTAVMSQEANTLCGMNEARQQLILQHPEILKQEEETEQFTKNFVARYQQWQNAQRSAGPIIIPIVFHIVNQGGPENISDAQVLDQVRILNRDYNKQNADTSLVVASFKSIIAKIGIQFRLANIDPYGNCTNGIERINSDQTYSGDDYSKLNTWPREKYLNVWVVKQMQHGVAGYAYYPADVVTLYNTPNYDGVIILQDYIGSIGTASLLHSRALTHEIGHYLNLQHPWGNNNDPGQSCGDDEVNDTPITRGSTSCNLGLSYCHAGVIENVQNYMDYSYCSVMFTEGQKARMLATLASNVSSRSNLYADSNLIATGTADTMRTPCAPVANFNVNLRYVCQGNSVTFLNSSGNSSPTDSMTYLWEFPNGVPDISFDKNPHVVFITEGWQPVKLTVTNAHGSSSKSDTSLVFVSFPNALYSAPYFEGFEDPSVFNQNEWVSANYDANNVYDNNVTWFKQTNAASHTGTGSAVLNNYNAHANDDIDEIISPGLDLTGLTAQQMNLSFYYSFASFNQDFSKLLDSFVVYGSANCGTTWSSIYKVSGVNALNAGYWQGPFVPEKGQDNFWKKVSINLPSSYKQAHIMFKFRVYTTVKGNNFYVDDINIGKALATGIEDISNITTVNIFPNPGNGNSFLNLNLAAPGKVSVKVYDITGKQALDVFDGTMTDGENQIEIHGSSLAAGIYVVNIIAGQSVMQRKLIVK